MASSDVHIVRYTVRDTITKSVTLAPERATIVREIIDVPIKPGSNEIIITGFDQVVDPDSLRVTGSGSATITDIQTQIVPQEEDFSDIYPQADEDLDDDLSDDPEDPDDTFGVDRSELDDVELELEKIKAKITALENEQSSSTKALEFLNNYGQTLIAKDIEPSKVQEYIETYQEERVRLNTTFTDAASSLAALAKEKSKLDRKLQSLARAYERERHLASKEWRKARTVKSKAQARRRQKRRLENGELCRFWPANVGRVTIYLDGVGDVVSSPVRPKSVVSNEKAPAHDVEYTDLITLSLTYVTTNALWSPRYELMLHTPTSSGKIIYRAEYHSYSPETWKDAKLILSTSQTNFSGVDERIPLLLPWNVKLNSNTQFTAKSIGGSSRVDDMDHWKGALRSTAEPAKHKLASSQKAPPGRPMAQPGGLFGNANPEYETPLLLCANAAPLPRGRPKMSAAAAPARQAFGSSGVQWEQQSQQQQRYMHHRLVHRSQESGTSDTNPDEEEEDDDEEEEEDDDASTFVSAPKPVGFGESVRHEYGLTTTFEIPGARTLAPSSHNRRHIIAELDLPSVFFSHVIIPKLKPAAFLQAKINNSTATRLLRGKGGLSVDEAFLGVATIPNCNPNATFNLNLGVDPGLQVTYAKPKVRRATTGFFNKEDCAIFTRVCRINNTKTTAVKITVFDQIPVSEDERLRIRMIEPKGVEKEGDVSSISASVCSNPKQKKTWGKGTVSIAKEGEVKWVINLAAGTGIKLVLEYEAKIPSGQKMVGLQ
ncbi:hypothetical protein FQN57_002690 [Myotisia sp. PD_48]|nr:hypothetical protein FQN57_002690 [Myotisia sp. PD_48]